jgi:hypothetical protein
MSARIVHSETLSTRLNARLAVVCAELGIAAIEARALFAAGKNSIVAYGEAAAADGDLQKLKRYPRADRAALR